MDEATVAKYIGILNSANTLNLKDPAGLARAQKVLAFANSLKGKQLPQALSIALLKFYDGVGARPEVAGVRTTIQGNKWDNMFPFRPVFPKK
jgi:hypothetical protein